LKRILLFVIVCFSALTFTFADLGIVLSEGFTAENKGESNFASKTTLAPWLSLPFGASDFYLSAGVSAYYDEELLFIPEIFRFELNIKPNPVFGLRLGRFYWHDPSRFIAFGYLDGADFSLNLGAARIGLAGFYTGFLYKDTASINISPGDRKDYSADFDWTDFADTYFAPRRFLASVYGDFPCFPIGRGNLDAGLLAQFDLSDSDESFNTQYLLLRYTTYYKRFDFAAGGALELENTKADGVKLAYAFSLEGGLQTGLTNDRFALGLRYASGSGPDTAAFFPLVREAQGVVFDPVLSGMMILRANYQARLHESFAFQFGGRYFIRTDSKSFTDPYIKNDSYLLGAEADAVVYWNPVSDLAFAFSGGIYFPQTGQAMASDAPQRWTFGLEAIFSF